MAKRKIYYRDRHGRFAPKGTGIGRQSGLSGDTITRSMIRANADSARSKARPIGVTYYGGNLGKRRSRSSGSGIRRAFSGIRRITR